MLRSFFAISSGFLATVVLAVGIDMIIQSYAPKTFAELNAQASAKLWLGLVYTNLATILGAYLTGRLAPSKPLTHALVLGGIELAASIAIAVFQWSTAPVWYHALVLLLVVPSAYVGGVMAARALGGRPVQIKNGA